MRVPVLVLGALAPQSVAAVPAKPTDLCCCCCCCCCSWRDCRSSARRSSREPEAAGRPEAVVLPGVALVLPGVRTPRRPGVAALVASFSLLPDDRFLAGLSMHSTSLLPSLLPARQPTGGGRFRPLDIAKDKNAAAVDC